MAHSKKILCLKEFHFFMSETDMFHQRKKEPTELVCHVALLFSLSLSIVNLLWQHNMVTTFINDFLSQKKVFVDRFIEILCTLARR